MNTYLKLAVRKIFKKKSVAVTKIVSLAIGLISLGFISIYVKNEYAYDRFHENRDHIVKLNTTMRSPTGDLELGLTATPVAEYVASASPAVATALRVYKEYGSRVLRFEEKLFSESENIYYTEPAFFEFFNFEVLKGDMSKALSAPHQIVLTESAARKYFGTLDVLTKVLLYDNEPFEVTGVVADPAPHSHLSFDFLVSLATFYSSRPQADQNWEWFPMNAYLLLEPHAIAEDLQMVLDAIPQYQEQEATTYQVTFEPLADLHFGEARLGELGIRIKKGNLYVLSSLALMILLLGVFNYINLSTAQLVNEAKDIGIRKSLGASKYHIQKQFIVESLLLSTLALVLSLGIMALFFTQFEQALGIRYDLKALLSVTDLLWIPVIPVLLTLLGGIYPAIRSSGTPFLGIKERVTGKIRWLDTRSALIVFQFIITGGLILGSMIIYKQVDYLTTKELGFDQSQKLVIDFGPNATIGRNHASLKSEMSTINGVREISFSSHVPGQQPNGVFTQITDEQGLLRTGDINLTLVDYDFFSTYQLELVAGRNFRNGPADLESAIILNESAVKAFGFNDPESILGRSHEQWGGNGRVIGVVKDFNYLSLHQEVGLLSLKVWPAQFQKITIDLETKALDETINQIEEKWHSIYPNQPFDHYFVNDNFQKQYEADKRFGKIISVFTGIAILIGMLGLFAYASFWCTARRKEIAIRKVLGASMEHIALKLSAHFLAPVFIGFLIAVPVSTYLGYEWLQSFAYQTSISFVLIALSVFSLVILSMLAVGSQTIALANINPVESLKDE